MRAVVPALFLVACGSSSPGGQAADASHGADAVPGLDAPLAGSDAPADGASLGDAAGDGSIPGDAGSPTAQILRINEVLANATNCDLVELRAIDGGDLTGLRLLERKDIVYTFPAMTVAPDDLIVVHFGAAANGPCHVGISTDETESPTEHPNAQFPTNFDGAYDLFSVDAGLASTDNVISVMKTTTVIDAVLVSDGPTGTAASASEDQAAVVAAQGQWVEVGGGLPAGGFVDDAFNANAALGLAASPTLSIQRLDNTDDNDLADWNTDAITAQPSTFGALNVGQTPL